jgi:hypothetical protein
MFLHVAEDPEAAWDRIAPHALHETNSYGDWLAEAGTPAPYGRVADAEALQASGLYLILTPEELLDRALALGPTGVLHFHPLMGGLDPDLAWSSLALFEKRVLPGLRDAGLV